MEPASLSEIVERIRSLAPFLDRAGAEHALSTTLEALATLLTSDERSQLAAALPGELAQSLRGAQPASGSPADLFADVAKRGHWPLGRAIELVQVTCHALGDALPRATLVRLARHLPELAPLLQPSEAPPIADVPPAVPQNTRDLAGGRPGSQRSIAASDPSILAHRHSVARNDDPHAEDKLSSSRGVSQERDDHTLATGRPGSNRPLSGRR